MKLESHSDLLQFHTNLISEFHSSSHEFKETLIEGGLYRCHLWQTERQSRFNPAVSVWEDVLVALNDEDDELYQKLILAQTTEAAWLRKSSPLTFIL